MGQNAPKPLVELRNLSHTYPDGRLALQDVSFALQRGERVALVGPNGAGKTTLFLRLCGVLPGRVGQVRMDTLDPAEATHRKLLPTKVGVVFQNPDDQLFSATVREDVAFGLLNLGRPIDEIRAQTEHALEQVGLAGCEDRVPHKLSGGEKRRAAIAGVLVMHPEVLLLDEPTMFLDPRGRRELIGLLKELPCTMIIATHDLALVLDTCSRVVILDAGRVVADGDSNTILANEELMERHGLEVPERFQR